MKSILLKSKSLFACSLLVMGLTSVGTAYAIDYKKSGKTTCYTFKNDKMLKKASCTYKGTGQYTGRSHQLKFTFKMQGVQQPIKVNLINYDWYADDATDDALNGKKATQLLRKKTNLKKTTEAGTNKDGTTDYMNCLKDKNGNEFCYAEGDLGTF